MKELTKKQKIFVLKEMIRYYEEIDKVDKDNCINLCKLMVGIAEQDLGLRERPLMVIEIFPEVTQYRPSMSYYWWPYGLSKPRLEYCKKILKLIESK